MMTDQDEPMESKICLVTGATAGMGAVTARALAQRDATVILVGRNPAKGAATVEQMRQQTGNPAVEFMLADLSVQGDVRQLAQQFKARYPRLDVLVNNAGATFGQRRETVDGLEMTLALNHLACFLLTNLLLDALQAGAPARVVNVSSFAHKLARINFDDLQGRRRYVGWQAYGRSKLANVLFTYELARRQAGAGVTANALDPGLVATDFGLRDTGIVRPSKRLLNLFALSPEEGAQTSIYLAASPEAAGVTGKYFVKCRAVSSSKASYDQIAAARLWRISAELTGLPAS
jgi:NAD(P)-dependent dehydrogenase (short-subunit alcohol dehydrogenase family)